jgi:PHD/YefM family antitoxin component YafN of YafNO toxin-antitoxin module
MNTFSVTDLRQKTNIVLSAATQFGYVPVVKNSKTSSYVVDAKYFQALQEAYEDYLDVLELEKGIKSAKNEPLVPLAQIDLN